MNAQQDDYGAVTTTMDFSTTTMDFTPFVLDFQCSPYVPCLLRAIFRARGSLHQVNAQKPLLIV